MARALVAAGAQRAARRPRDGDAARPRWPTVARQGARDPGGGARRRPHHRRRAARQLRDIAVARGVNVLVNNAAMPCFGALGGHRRRARSHGVIGTNLVAPIAAHARAAAAPRAQPRAIVLNVGSTLGRLGLPGFAVYAASKFGLRGFTEALRRELAGSRVDVLYLAPRATTTAFNSDRVAAFNRAHRHARGRPRGRRRGDPAHARASAPPSASSAFPNASRCA